MSRLLPCPPLPCCFCPRVSAGIFLCFVTVSCVFLCGSAFAVLPPFVSFLDKRLWRLLATLSGLVFPCRWPAETQSLMVAHYLVVDLLRLLRALAASTTRIRVWLAVQFFLRAMCQSLHQLMLQLVLRLLCPRHRPSFTSLFRFLLAAHRHRHRLGLQP